MPYYSASKLPDSDGDGKIKLSSAKGSYKKGSTIKWCPDAPVIDPAKPYCYVGVNQTCPAAAPPVEPVPVEPAPPPPPPPPPEPTPEPSNVKSAIVANEAFFENDVLTVGFSPAGGIGSLTAAPAGYRTDTATGLLRVGFYAPPANDCILQGRAIEGFSVGARIGGVAKVARNFTLTGYSEAPGSWAAAVWAGAAVFGLKVEQRITVEGKRLRFDVALTNTTSARMDDVQYMRAADLDQSDLYNTANRIVSAGTVEAGLPNNAGTFFMETSDPRAFATFHGAVPTLQLSPYEAIRKPIGGTVKTSDELIRLVWVLGALDVGASTTLSFGMGLR